AGANGQRESRRHAGVDQPRREDRRQPQGTDGGPARTGRLQVAAEVPGVPAVGSNSNGNNNGNNNQSGSSRALLLQPFKERSAAQTQASSGFGLVAANFGHRAADQIPLHGLDVSAEVDRPVWRPLAIGRGAPRFLATEPALVNRDLFAVGEDRPAFDDVLQL